MSFIRLRLLLAGLVFSTLFGVIAGRAVYLQIFQGPWLSAKAAGQYEQALSIRGRRGTIYDANHQELAVSIDVTSIAAFPSQIQDAGLAAKVLAGVLDLNRRELRSRLTSDKSFVWVKRQASPQQVKKIKALDLAGIEFLSEHSRFYPNRSLAAQVVGFSGIDGKGLEGIEFFYENDLKGPEEHLRLLRDARGRAFDGEKRATPGAQGHNVILTLDHRIQYIAENALEAAVTTHNAKSGMVLVMDPRKGALLAVAHYPFFNPNTFGSYDRFAWRNRAITDPFEPGSTMKIFSAAAALESGVCTPNTIFYCENGAYRIGPKIVHDTHPHGWLSIQQIVKYSSNIGSIKLSEVLGRENLYRNLTSFGFGDPTDIDCPGEAGGILMPYQRWTHIDTGAISFGQGISVTALQLITAVSAIANGGNLMKPYLVQAITDQNGKLLKQFEPRVVHRAISKQTAQCMAAIMATVTTEGGTGGNAALEGYEVAGKTGTAQKVDPSQGGYAKNKYVASFTGFVPAQNPAVAILVVVDEPHGSYYGGQVAAPAFREIARETLHYLNIAPGTTQRRITAHGGNEGRG